MTIFIQINIIVIKKRKQIKINFCFINFFNLLLTQRCILLVYLLLTRALTVIKSNKNKRLKLLSNKFQYI